MQKMITTALAVTITNKNKFGVNYSIMNIAECSKGEIGARGQVVWVGSVLCGTPDTIGVHVKGLTSSTGSFLLGIKNVGCELEVVDAGFMQGIKLQKVKGSRC